ncbi:MAG TPA: flagellin [Actinotalea sp.]|nr:flagellin [Actinotalea sp.]
MGLSINQNIAAINSYRNLSNTQNDLSKSLEKLSSGFRINRAADDAAGLAISEGLRSQVGGLKVAARNAQDGISVVQTAEGALTEVHAILQRMRDLGVQAANDSNNASARSNITTEATSLREELSRIAASTNFNGTDLLNGAGTLNFQVGADGDANSAIAVDLSSANVSAVASNLQNGLYSRTGALAPATVTGNFTISQGSVAVTVDMGAVNAARTSGNVVDTLNGDAGFAANFSARLDQAGELVVTSKTSNAAVTVAGTGYTAGAGVAGALDFSSHAGAQGAINTIDLQISQVSTARANLGAMQNRFEHTIKNINVAVENLSASESRIRDTDMASEMVQFTRAQILSQAGTAMLAQANQIPQGVLSLLR